MMKGWLLCCCILLAGCSNSNKDLRQYIKVLKQRPLKPLARIPELRPWVLPKDQTMDRIANPFRFETKQDLENQSMDYSLRQLKWVGLLKQGSRVWVLIKQPDNQVHRFTVGDRLGKEKANLLAINDNCLELEEKNRIRGSWMTSKFVLCLNNFQRSNQ